MRELERRLEDARAVLEDCLQYGSFNQIQEAMDDLLNLEEILEREKILQGIDEGGN